MCRFITIYSNLLLLSFQKFRLTLDFMTATLSLFDVCCRVYFYFGHSEPETPATTKGYVSILSRNKMPWQQTQLYQTHKKKKSNSTNKLHFLIDSWEWYNTRIKDEHLIMLILCLALPKIYPACLYPNIFSHSGPATSQPTRSPGYRMDDYALVVQFQRLLPG